MLNELQSSIITSVESFTFTIKQTNPKISLLYISDVFSIFVTTLVWQGLWHSSVYELASLSFPKSQVELLQLEPDLWDHFLTWEIQHGQSCIVLFLSHFLFRFTKYHHQLITITISTFSCTISLFSVYNYVSFSASFFWSKYCFFSFFLS